MIERLCWYGGMNFELLPGDFHALEGETILEIVEIGGEEENAVGLDDRQDGNSVCKVRRTIQPIPVPFDDFEERAVWPQSSQVA